MRKAPLRGRFLFEETGERILRRAALAQDDRDIGRVRTSACHSERGAPRSEFEMNMLAGGKHTTDAEPKNPYLL